MRIERSLLTLLALALASSSTARPARVDPARIAKHVETLASDAFQGRFPGTPGEQLTTDYIVRQFSSVGLKPGGDVTGGKRSWLQRVPMLTATIVGTPTLTLITPHGPESWTAGKQMTVRADLRAAGTVDIAAAPLVFVGYGVFAPERQWDDYKGIDLTGKIAVILANDPDSEGGEGDFGGKTVTTYGFGQHKIEQAVKRGAVGVLIVHDPALSGYGWLTVANSDARPKLDIERPVPRVRAGLEGAIDRPVIEALFHHAGLDFTRARTDARTRAFRPVALPGFALSAHFATTHVRSASHNVIGLLPGARHADEAVLFGAHWDHIGTGAPDATGDRVYHGAIDNASGVAMVIELARTLAARPRANRSIEFAAFTLEEVGILGSEYHALQPAFPLAKTAAVIVLDGAFPMGRAHDFSNWAQTDTTLNDLLVAEGARHGRRFTPDAHPEQAFAFRTDHSPFAKRGVPPIFFQPGQDLLDGGLAKGSAVVSDWLTRCYHRQCDHYSPDWNLEGNAEDVQLLADVGYRVANERQWPTWHAGSEFGTIRSTTDGERK